MIAPGVLDTDRLRRFAGATAQARGVSIETVLDEYRSHSPLNRLTTVDQVSWAVTQLLATEADALHGATLALDGGARRGLF
jgi:NAD(P)-dependent dehydrogenase (short-subunit alcohol dehydrogenase family)